MSDLQPEPLPESPALVTFMPSVLEAAALDGLGSGHVAALSELPALQQWVDAFQDLLADQPDVVPELLAAHRDNGVASVNQLDGLVRLGAVTIDGAFARLTPLGLRGLFSSGRWADPAYWLLDPGEWWIDLSIEDTVAFVAAAAQLRLVDQAWTVQAWFDQADPLEFAYQLAHATPLHGAQLNVAFYYLKRIGLEAAPAVEEWLVNPARAGLAALWFDLIGAPRPGIPTAEEQAYLRAEQVRSIDDVHQFLARLIAEPPEPSLPGTTIDELIYTLPPRLATANVGELLHSLLNVDLPERPGDRVELEHLLTEARAQLSA
ncbi:hypothetical protein F1D05_04815 [Kribbella qitaiheensis]|uniref:Uncharacterized protein n=1 Tax=Kribbella qitaiheensis TaxID=1544730 RepID=A0A7G6WTP9_9ACTN|nr:hypothetical protein [Kribbella qitaiheensis]QNE17364.1 hypothetical protein F1D05_04815 [Kribbella qitaiheensis]